MHRKRTRRILGDLKKSVSWELETEREDSTFGARRGQTNLRATSAARDVGGDRWKSQNRKNVYLSPCVEEPLNSKVIKSFVPKRRSRKCFSCFGIPMFYIYMLWTFYKRCPWCNGYRRKKWTQRHEFKWCPKNERWATNLKSWWGWEILTYMHS